MTGSEIVREEALKLARGMLPLALITFGVLALAGQASVRAAFSLLVGTAFALLLFVLMGNSAVRSLMFGPGGAESRQRRGYVFRYFLTGAFIVLVLNTPFFHPWAAILPLFFPKLVLLAGSIFRGKEGK